MISAVRELGMLSLKISNKSEIATLIKTINSENYPNMIVVELEQQHPYSLQRIDLEETNAPGSSKYLYRKGATNGANFSPTAIITEVAKTFQVKVLGWFNAVKKMELEAEDQTFFNSIKDTLEKNQARIIKDIQNILAGSKKGAAITIRLGKRYLEEIPVFRNAFLKKYTDEQDKITAYNKTCSICGQKKPKVAAGTPFFKFYTIDKPGFITGHFDKLKSWRNYPVCPECALALDEGKRVLQKKLTFQFYGLRYMLIPKVMIGDTLPQVAVKLIRAEHKIGINETVGKKLTSYEDEILEIMAQENDTMTLDFLFLESQNSADWIVLLVNDVLPSRLRALFAAKDKIDQVFPGQQFHLGRIRTFFAKSDPGKRENDLDKYFWEIIDAIFSGKTVSMPFLAVNFMREIRRDFNNGQGKLFKVLDAIQALKFFSELKMIVPKEVSMQSTIFDSVFLNYIQQLDTPEKRGIFLLGALSKMLLNVQYRERKATPFLVQLMGLKLDESKIKGLLPKVVNKFQEYKRFDTGKAKLAESISEYMLQSEKRWNLTLDEINFYFVCGMNLYNQINKVLYGKEEEEITDDNE